MLFLNQQGGRLSTAGAHTTIAAAAGPDEKTTAHVLRHTFATNLVRDGADLVIVAELLGHARTDTARIYTLPTENDLQAALDRVTVDY
ncbi:tyrosine-type recombinase/integrase [Frankia sp. Mgl5]|uniref:tyrosine-type recombinase/integrase n=1 Tax=Frankia sp. Mgl5 TaxID=2933793 RepID=UPI00200EDF63|nr:tyrosine-type recombinase/integrase [Frankia sp. Mgl5]MCK9928159.1 tyrosine-type recombinase/integrase [Frankia sp. Mgl5]